MSETASFVDPVYLARFGLFRANVLNYFLHPLNPFRTTANTSNEYLEMQQVTIGLLMQVGIPNANSNGVNVPMPPKAAEEEYAKALSRLTGEQYELLPPLDPIFYAQPSPLYTIRHVLRKNASNVKILGIYYVVEGVIYKSPSVRSLMKANVTRTLDGLSGACSALSVCARYQPALGYTWNFENKEDDIDPVSLMKLNKRTKRRKILDNRKTGERNEAEEEGLRATSAIDQILVRLSKSNVLTAATIKTSNGGGGKSGTTATTTSSTKNHDQSSTIEVAEPTSVNSPPPSVVRRQRRRPSPSPSPGSGGDNDDDDVAMTLLKEEEKVVEEEKQ